MISISKEVKKISYLSCVELALNVAPVSSFGIVLLSGLLMVNMSTSQPSVLMLFGLRDITIFSSSVMFALKKFFFGFMVFPNAVKVELLFAFMERPSPVILLSPSKVATPILAFTGNGLGRVVKPFIGISKVFPDFIPAYPSKVVINLPGRSGCS